MPGQVSHDSNESFIALERIPGGGVGFTYNYPPDTAVRQWPMSPEQALGLAVRTLVLLRYRELRVRQDLTTQMAEEWMPGEDVPGTASLDLGDAVIDMVYVTGGCVGYTYSSPPGTAVLRWEMSRSQALGLATRTTGLLGYRELHVEKDFTIFRIA